MATVVLSAPARRPRAPQRLELVDGRPDVPVDPPAPAPAPTADENQTPRPLPMVNVTMVSGAPVVEDRRPRNIGAMTFNAGWVGAPRPDPRELHRVEVGEIVMVMRESGSVALYAKSSGQSRVVITAAGLDDLAIALDDMLGHRKVPVSR